MKKALLLILLLVAGASIDASAFRIKKKSEVEPFERGIKLPNSCFIPQGTVGGGIAVSYNNYKMGNGTNDSGYQTLFNLIKNVHGNMHSFGVAPFVSYFFADNVSVGLRFDYSRAGFKLNTAELAVGDLASFNLDKLAYLKQSYLGSLSLRNYIPFNQGRRFAMFTELRFTGGYGQSETYHTVEQDKFGTYQDIYKFSVGLVPGLTCFVTNELAIEASIGILGYDYEKVVQVTNQVETSQMVNRQANFKLNLFSINLGLSFYIPTGGHRPKKATK